MQDHLVALVPDALGPESATKLRPCPAAATRPNARARPVRLIATGAPAVDHRLAHGFVGERGDRVAAGALRMGGSGRSSATRLTQVQHAGVLAGSSYARADQGRGRRARTLGLRVERQVGVVCNPRGRRPPECDASKWKGLRNGEAPTRASSHSDVSADIATASGREDRGRICMTVSPATNRTFPPGAVITSAVVRHSTYPRHTCAITGSTLTCREPSVVRQWVVDEQLSEGGSSGSERIQAWSPLRRWGRVGEVPRAAVLLPPRVGGSKE
jgi:hypothetical protein